MGHAACSPQHQRATLSSPAMLAQPQLMPPGSALLLGGVRRCTPAASQRRPAAGPAWLMRVLIWLTASGGALSSLSVKDDGRGACKHVQRCGRAGDAVEP